MKTRMELTKGKAYQRLYVDDYHVMSVWGEVAEVEQCRDDWRFVRIDGTNCFCHVNEVVWKEGG